ncbi:hypothetical protein C1645_743390 [Glomus cerebriforme]|uniref:Uncharacterized protein n=1 Tax=Glomus cerebriforme TaxID=658196 RepID=A0A397SKB8_9GLOM|nr:hypothetical protein C1645_743390 [Glomus cerebriforme]
MGSKIGKKQYDLEAVRPPTKEELKNSSEAGLGSRTQALRKSNRSNLINKEFEHLEEIKKRQERSEKDLEFRKQEELGTAVKRRAITLYHAKVPKSHPDNGNDI